MVIVFFVVVETLMFIPYVGLMAKVALSGLLGAQVLVLFSMAASGQPPKLGHLLRVFSLPPSAQLVLVAASLLPFLLALGYLVAQGGGLHSVAYFFGNILATKPPALDTFFILKIILYVASLPLTFIGAAVVLRGLSGWSAVIKGVRASIRNWPAPLALIGPAILLEWLMVNLPLFLPRPAVAAVAVTVLVMFVGWSFSFLYTLSARAFGMPDGRVQPAS